MKRVNKETKAMKQAIKDMIANDVNTQVLKLDAIFKSNHQVSNDTYYNVSY